MFFFQAEDGIRDKLVTGVQTCALPISYYVRAQKVRTLIKQDFERKFDAGVHAMLTPTTPSAAFGLGAKSSGDPIEMYLNDVFTVTVNMAGLCGRLVSAGRGGRGPPPRVQVLRRPLGGGGPVFVGVVVV